MARNLIHKLKTDNDDRSMKWPLNRFHLTLLCCAWLFALAATARAQYRFDHWTTDNGLPQNSIRKIVQTPDGYLWFTTFDGLVRFDGVRFTVFNKGNTQGISTNRFSTLYAADDGALWAGTEDGGLVIYRNGGFTSYPAGNGFTPHWIYAISPDPQGELFLSTLDGPFYLRNGQFKPAPAEYDSPTSRFYVGPSGKYWILDQRGVRESKNGHVTEYCIKLDFSNELYRHLTCYEDSKGRLWFGDYGHLYALKDGVVTHYDQKSGIPPLPAFTVLRPYCEDDNGGLWLAAGRTNQNNGLGLMCLKDGQFTVHGAETEIPNNIVNDVFKDREGIIWVGTNNGLRAINRQIITTYSSAHGILNKETYPLLELGDGSLLAGTIDGLSRFNHGRFSTVLGVWRGVSWNVQALYEDRTGRLWIGAIGGLIWSESGRLNLHKDIKPENNVWAVRTDRDGNLWVATAQGLFKFRDREMIASYTTKDGLPGNDVKVIHQARDGTLWFGAYGGLAQFKDDRFKAYTARDGLTGDRVRSIYEDAEGTLWIGTYDEGLSRFRDGKFVNYKVENGLFNNGVFQILEDRQGRFWISSNKGIYRVSRQQLNDFAGGRIEKITCVAYGKADGMLNSECNGGRQPAGIKTRDGRLWFPTMDGVAMIDPDAVTVNKLPPPLIIEQVSVDRSPVEFSKEITLQPGQDDLEISYTALSFTKPEQIRFKYHLVGRDDEWTEAGTRRVAYYPYLPPGGYTFQVLAANSDGVWNRQGASIRIIVLAPFYKRRWFLIACSGLTAGAALFIFRARVVQLQKKQAVQEEFSRQLIASQEQERQRIAVELHDGLGQSLVIIRNRTLISLAKPDDHDRAITQIGEISEAATSALVEIRQLASSLHPYQIDRLGLASAIEEMVARLKDSSEINFTCEIDELGAELSKEAQINLYRIVQESLNNIIKHSAALEAAIHLKKSANRLRLTIQDNGKGFDVGQLADRKHGLGLTGMAERAKVLRAKPEIHSVPGQGTTISLEIQLENLANEP